MNIKSLFQALLLRGLYLMALVLSLLAPHAIAQETRGTMAGIVTDSSGAIVPDAQVSVANTAMGTTVTVKTNAEGYYSVPLLLPGAYQVSITAQGVKRFVGQNVQIQVADRIEVNARLELGASEQTGTISAAAESLNTVTASMGNVVTSQQIMDLPLTYGNPFELIGVSSGASFRAIPGWTALSDAKRRGALKRATNQAWARLPNTK